MNAPQPPQPPRAPLHPQLHALVARVQHNCHVADARHAAELTLCTYLLQMREYFRWEQGLALGRPLAREAVGAWMAEREALWESLAEEDYGPLPLPGVAGTAADPFDVEAVNAVLAPHALLYGAGLVAGGRPVFFMADLHRRGERGGLPVLQAGRELARTLLAPPAALAGGGAGPIVLRRESMARWCWERAEAFGMRPQAASPAPPLQPLQKGGAQQAMLVHYGLDRDFHAGLPRWLDDQCETAVWHELGEHELTQRWGARWSELRALWDDAAGAEAPALLEAPDRLEEGDAPEAAEVAEAAESADAPDAPDANTPQPPRGPGRGGPSAVRAGAAQARRADALVRALRDQLADLSVTLPALLARGDPGPLHAWFASYEGLREATFPALTAGYAAWRGGDGGAMLRDQQRAGLRHFVAVATGLLEGPVQARRAAGARLMQPAAAGVPASMVCAWPTAGL